MPTYKLKYFNARGRAELSRMIFAATEQLFEDIRVEFQEWPAFKAKTPQGSLPILEVDGKKPICQSFAIARYLAREFKMYGTDNTEMAGVDQILDTLLDIFGPFSQIAFGPEEGKASQMAEFNEKTAPKVLGYLENLVKENGSCGFAVGYKLTVADLALYVYIENCRLQSMLKSYPRLQENRKKVADIPAIAKYLASRKDTPF